MNTVIDIINQIDEPKKPVIPQVVPQFVANWIQGAKYNGFDLYEAMTDDEMPNKVATWIDGNSEAFANAWFYGYEVKKETLYTARFKASQEYLHFDKDYKELHHSRVSENIAENHSGYWFTKEMLVKYSLWDNPAFEVEDVENATGIKIYGKRIKSIVYSLDVSLIANTDADAILCVYPFTPNTQILNVVSLVAKSPILVGVGGGLTSGERSARLASHAEENNASGIVLNGPVDIATTKKVREYVDIPIIYTVIDKSRPLQQYIDAGVNIFNVSGGKNTVELVKWVREQYPEFPIIASGGKTDKSIQNTINAGANAITYTAYGMMEEYFHTKMEQYRDNEKRK